jgi:3',5'-cyclic AMP phosphodiesterase CpdA
MTLVAHLSDLHFGDHEPAALEALARRLAEVQPQVIAVSGDLTQRARRDEFRAARGFLDLQQALGAAVVAVPGNHDLPLFNLLRRFTDPAARFRAYIGDDGEYRDGAVHLVGLNSARRSRIAAGRIRRRERASMAQAFASGTTARTVSAVVVHHAPGMTRSGPRDAVDGSHLRQLRDLADAGVQLVLAGHHHRSGSATFEDAILVVQAGTACSRRTRGEPHGFNLLTVEDGTVTVDVQQRDGRSFASAKRAVYRLSPAAG